MPAELEKAADGNWKLKGLASTQGLDQQGEMIVQKGIDLSPIDNKKGIINWDHQKGVENILGTLDGYSFGKQGLYIEGRLFKNHDKAKAVQQIMSSLGSDDHGRMGLSVEGSILERDPNNPKIIKKCKINAVALTMNPVNTDTYADLIKSMADIDFESTKDATEDNIVEEASDDIQATFSADQVVAIVKKALGMSPEGSYSKAPNELTDGDAMATSDMKAPGKDKKKKKKDDLQDESQAAAQQNGLNKGKDLKPMTSDLYKSNILRMMDKLQKLHPDVSRVDIWEAVKDRLDTQFPDIYSAQEEN